MVNGTITIVDVCISRLNMQNTISNEDKAKITNAGLNNKSNLAAMVRYLERPVEN